MRPLAALALASLAACETPATPAELTTGETHVLAGSAATDHADALLTSLTDPRQSGPLAPRDECGALDGADSFRKALADAVITRDTEALVALADADIKLDFGGGDGVAELRRRLSDPGYHIWEELEKVMPLGCAVNSQGGITMPWYFAQDFGEIDGFSAMIVMGEDVPMRTAPRSDANMISSMSWDFVEMKSDLGGKEDFVAVGDYRGGEGYIRQSKLRSLVDYRLIAERVGNQWMITAFVAGD